MSTITIYPLFSNYVQIQNLVKYATDSGFTVTNYTSLTTDSTGLSWSVLIVSQVLTPTQQSTIKSLFSGTAYIVFT